MSTKNPNKNNTIQNNCYGSKKKGNQKALSFLAGDFNNREYDNYPFYDNCIFGSCPDIICEVCGSDHRVKNNFKVATTSIEAIPMLFQRITIAGGMSN
jgi:hypothetical protein